MIKYYEISGLEHIYLEDSFVLKIEEWDDRLEFLLDLVLTEKHSQYTSPTDDEQYCYKKAFLVFKKCDAINWIEKGENSFFDSSGETDYGNIDSLTQEGKNYHLSGDWGEVKLVTDQIELSFV
jgi:hypothetical protein